MKDDGSWIHGSRMKLDIGCWLMDHGWMGEAGFWTCPEALEWVVGGVQSCVAVLGSFGVVLGEGFGGFWRRFCWEGTREPWDGSRRGPCRGPWRGTGADG